MPLRSLDTVGGVGTRGRDTVRRRARLAALVASVMAAGACAAMPWAAVTPEPTPGGGAERLVQLVDVLRVAPEAPRSGYSRELFEHWVDLDGSGCRTRADVLARQALGLVQRDRTRWCVIVEGDWYSPFDGVRHTGDPAEIDVDHVVALAEAWDSGAHAWTALRRMQFANDPLHLLVVTRSSNQDKADLDAAEWRPERRDAWCLTASMMVLTKVRYDLGIDPAERAALVDMAASCDRDDQRTAGGFPLPGSPAFDDLAQAVLAERGS